MVGIRFVLGQEHADVFGSFLLIGLCSVLIFHHPPDEYSEMWYAWILGELKAALGTPGKGRLQNLTACMLSLDVVFHLARKARSADRDTFRPPNATMHKVYGVQSGFGGAKFEIIVMEAQTEAQSPEVAGGRPSLSEDQQRPEAVNSELGNTPDELVIVGYVSAIPWRRANLLHLHRSACRFDIEL